MFPSNSDFDKTFNRTALFIKGWIIFVGILIVGMLGFAGWIIVKLLQHFGVIG